MPPPARHSGIRSRFRAHNPPSGSGEPTVRADAPYSGSRLGVRPNSGFPTGFQAHRKEPGLRHLVGDTPGAPPWMRPAQLAHQRFGLRSQPNGASISARAMTRCPELAAASYREDHRCRTCPGGHPRPSPPSQPAHPLPRRSPVPDASWRSSAAFTTIATCSPARGSPPALGVHPGADHLRAARHRLRPRPAQPGRHRPGGEVPPPPPTWMRHAMTSWPSPPSSRDLATRVWSSNPLERLNKEIRRLAMWPAYSRAGMPSSASPVPFLPSRKAGAMPGPDRLRLPGGPLRPGRITQGR